jgi:signal transduction histidine kinase
MSDKHALVLDIVQLLNPPPSITISIEGQLPKFGTYPAPLEQVLRNLISNAVKHHPGPQGRVVVSCQEKGDHYLYAVADDGEGIQAQYAERVFEMFQTLKSRDQVEGSGMGLAIVNRIVQWQRGRVWFEPNPQGRGTVFKFEWKKRQPLAANVETQACVAAK